MNIDQADDLKTWSGDLLDTFGDKIFDADFWREFSPALDISSKANNAIFDLTTIDKERYTNKLIKEGYIHVHQPGLIAPFPEMTALFDKFADAGLPPVFGFVYDEFWLMGTQLYNLLSAVMGEKYAMLPDFWSWRVSPGQTGWSPHRDKTVGALFPDKRPKSVTVWLPLNEAHPLNGCIYVLPADRDAFYGHDNPQRFGGTLPDIRALPGNSGDVFVWTQHVFHWGSHSADDHHLPPRMSIAFEFQRLDVVPFNRPLLNPLITPTFEERLALIAKQVLQYRHMYSFTADLVELATRINQRHKLPADTVEIPTAYI